MTRQMQPAARPCSHGGPSAAAIGCPSSRRPPAQPAAGTDADLFPDAVARLLAVANAELNRHANDRGQCCACRTRFPCPRACLAEQILGWF